MEETPRSPPPVRPPPPVPAPEPETPPPESLPSTPGEDYHTPTPSLDEAREETPPWQQETNGRAADKSPPPSPVRLPAQHRLPPPNSPSGNGRDGAAGQVAPGLVRTLSQGSLAKSPSPSHGSLAKSPSPSHGSLAKSPSPSHGSLAKSPSPSQGSLAKSPSPSQGSLAKSPSPSHGSLAKSPSPSHGSLAKSPSPSPSPTPPSLLTPAPASKANTKSGQSTPKSAEAWRPPASSIAVQFDPVEEAVTSPLRLGNSQFDQLRSAPAAAENGGMATTVPRDVAAEAAVGERRTLSVALRLATAVLTLASFAVMLSARTSGWDGDYYGRYVQYRYAVAVNVIVCIYSIVQALGEIRRLVSQRFIFRSMSSYYFRLFLDQILAYLLMSASSAAASRNDLWVSRFGQDPFNRKISSAVWLSFFGFIALAASSLISTANLFSIV